MLKTTFITSLFILLFPLFSISQVQFSDNNLNDVLNPLERHLIDNLDMTQTNVDYQFSNTEKKIVFSYLPKISFEEYPEGIQVIFKVHPQGNTLIVDSANLTGDADLILKFYVAFWETEVFPDRETGNLVMNYYLNDNVYFNFLVGNRAEIKVTKRI